MKKILFITIFIFNTHLIAGCYERVDLSDIGSETPAYKCEDGTVSFSQSTRYSKRKEKKDNYESLCGAVAAANVFHAYCDKLFVNHVKIAEKYFYDITPGIRPSTLTNGLTEMFENNKECMEGVWKNYYSTNRWDFLDSLYYEVRRGNGYWVRKINTVAEARRSPVIVLISKNSDAKILHYVTVVDIIGYNPNSGDQDAYTSDKCKVIYNDFGSQTSKSCHKFVQYANQVDNQLFTMTLNEYTHLVFEPSYIAKTAQKMGRMMSLKAEVRTRPRLKSIKHIQSRK